MNQSGKVLPNRKHIVITRDKNYKINDENAKIINDINELDEFINDDKENFVIGGAIIYSQLITKANKLYITRIHKVYEGDAYFPKINEEEWKIVEKEKGIKNEKNPFDYDYITYIRK